MVVRIQGAGQYRLDAAAQAELDALDGEVIAAVDRKDIEGAHALLGQAIALVRERGVALAADDLSSSDLILPPIDASLDEIHALVHVA